MVENDDEILEKWCEKEELNYQLASELKTKIFPLFEEAHQRLGHLFDKAFLEQRRGTEIRLDNSKTILGLSGKLKPSFFSAKEQKIITLHLEYLTLVEGLFTAQTNFLIFTLVANGHDLYDTRKEENVKTLRDIEKLNLAFRLRFLAEHGFKLITKKIDIKLRNSVAHLFYEINETEP